MLDQFWNYVCALCREWIALLSGGLITVALGLWERYQGKSVPGGTYGFVIGLCLFVASFLAWRKEYSANRTGPDIIMEWESSSGHQDVLTLRNIGISTALNVKVGNFSWAELTWRHSIEVQFIEPQQSVKEEPSFLWSVIPTHSDLGYMWRCLISGEDKPERLNVTATFQDRHRNLFTRTFILRHPDNLVHQRVFVDLGKLTIQRLSS